MLLGVYLFHAWSYLFLNDDAYISFRYALNWVELGEVSYNPGERVEGYTNFLWVSLLAAVYALGISIPTASLILSGLLGIITLISSGALANYMAQRADGALNEHSTLSQSRRMITLSLLAISPSFACWTSGGLEVMLFSATLSLGLALSAWTWSAGHLTEKRSMCVGALAGFSLGLSAMTRPEGVMIFGLVGLYRLWVLVRARSWLTSSDWGGILGFVLLYIPYYIWRYGYYGYPFPNTYYAKVGALGFWEPGLRYVGEWLLFHMWLMTPVVLWLVRLFSSKKSEEHEPWEGERHLGRVTILCGLALCIHVAKVGGDFMALHRFLVPLLPLSAALCSRSLASLYRSLVSTVSLDQRWIKFSAIMILAASAVLIHRDANRIGSRGGVDSIGWLRQFSEQCAQTGRYINQHTPEASKLATTAAGALPFYAKRYTVDLLGLNDEWIAHHVPARGQRPGHTKAAPFRYPIDQGVDYLVYHPTFSLSQPKPSVRMQRVLSPHGYRWESYRVPGLSPPWWSVWKRSPSPPKVDSSL